MSTSLGIKYEDGKRLDVDDEGRVNIVLNAKGVIISEGGFGWECEPVTATSQSFVGVG